LLGIGWVAEVVLGFRMIPKTAYFAAMNINQPKLRNTIALIVVELFAMIIARGALIDDLEADICRASHIIGF